jgi:sugar phosphate isomerase/epimerase
MRTSQKNGAQFEFELEQQKQMVRVGGHGLPVKSDDPYAFARAHVEFGYGAAYCPPMKASDTTRIADFRKAFEKEGITIAEIGIWRNLVTHDDRRKAHRDYAAECLAVADEVGAKCAVSYIGSYAPNSDYGPDPANLTAAAFDDAVETARYLIDTVKPKQAKFALEMEQYSLPDSVDCYRDMIRAVDRPAFAAHVDPVNLILTPRQYYNSAALLREIFDKLGPWIVSCHAKDILLHHQAALHFDEVMLGEGQLDYRAYLRELDKLGRDVPLMLEHLDDPGYAKARDYIFKVGDEIGVGFTGRKS